jgi:Prokaryotic phospholipase A2
MFKTIFTILVSTMLLFGFNLPTQAVFYSTKVSNLITQKVDYCGIESTWTQRIPERPFGYNFAPYCQLHDICYTQIQNHQSLAAIDSAKKRCDLKFKTNLYTYCGGLENNRKPITRFSLRFRLNQFGCRRTADAYYLAIRNYQNRLTKKQSSKDAKQLTYSS